MAEKLDMKSQYLTFIDSLPLETEQKAYLVSRWLDQVTWMEGRAKTCQGRYYFGMTVAIAGGVVVPALGAFANRSDSAQAGVVIIGILVALATTLEGFFKFGERWRHYRRATEALKKEWWLYYELSNGYAGRDHKGSFTSFVGKVEGILAADVDAFLTTVTVGKTPTTSGKGGAT